MRSAKLTLAAALALTVAAIALVLSHAPLVVAGTNSVAQEATAELNDGLSHASACQQAGVVPQGTTAIRIAVEVLAVGPSISLELLSGSHVVTEGHLPSGWGVATSATVPVRRVPQTLQHARLCITFGPSVEPIRVRGSPVNPNATAVHSLGEIRLGAEYLRPGASSWLSLASTLARHMGIENAAGGAWVAFPLIALMLAATVLAGLLAVRELTGAERDEPAELPAASARGRRIRELARRVPRAAWVCALVAVLNAACWSIIMPPFQVPDEQDHFAYTQQLVENLRLPESGSSQYSAEEVGVLLDLHHEEVRGSPETPTISSPEAQQILRSTLSEHLSRDPSGVGGASHYPPLYYLLETIPYGLAAPGTLLDQLELMRLFSALLGGVSALFAFLFVREALPARRWAWTVGGLCIALAPVLGFMSGSVNPDALLFAVSAAIFYCLARAFRRGLTPGLAAAIGGLIAAGSLTKPNFAGLVPGIVLGLVVLAAKTMRTRGPRAAVVSLGLAVAIGAAPVCVYLLVNVLTGQAPLGIVSMALGSGTGPGSALDKLSYIWQLYLPRLPGMLNDFPGLFTTRLWFDRSIGFYGWLDTTFPVWVDNAALIPAGAIGLLLVRALVGARAALRGRLAELISYAAVGVGLMALVGAGSYLRRGNEGLSFAEPRYLAPLLPLLAVALALAARGAGRRWGPAAGAAIIVLFLAHDIFSQLLVIGRYYV